MYEVMAVWDTPQMLVDASPVTKDFAEIWRAADKVAYSSSRFGSGVVFLRYRTSLPDPHE